MKKCLVVALALVGEFISACAADCPRWLSVMPLNEENIASVSADAVSLGNETIVDGIAWSFSVCPSGDPAADLASVYAARYRQMEPLVRSASKVKVGVLMQSTMGHGGLPGSPSRFQRVVRPDGTSFYRMCPLDPGFLAYIASACRTFSALKPDFFMVDDDTRLTLGNESPGCFCPLHLAEFGRRTGRTWTREEVLAAVRADAGMWTAWATLTADSLAGLMRVIRDNYDPSIPGILCVWGSAGHIEHARRLAEILAAPGQTGATVAAGRADQLRADVAERKLQAVDRRTSARAGRFFARRRLLPWRRAGDMSFRNDAKRRTHSRAQSP